MATKRTQPNAATKTATKTATPALSTQQRELPRIWRTPEANFSYGVPEEGEDTVTSNAVYTDEVLAGIAASGFNAIWVHGLLHHLVPFKPIPEFGQKSKMHLDNLKQLVKRAKKHGLRVFLYMQPPLGFEHNDPIWQAHPELKGAPMGWENIDASLTTYNAMCTSQPTTKKFLRESPEKLFKAIPDLGGLIIISASEFPSHCYRSFAGYSGSDLSMLQENEERACPLCHKRTVEDVIGEILTLVKDGMNAAAPDAQFAVWNWSWNGFEADPSPKIIGAVPDGSILQVDFERGDSRVILGKERVIDEYSLAFAGPSKRFLDSYKIAKKRGMPVIAKLQLGTTHELATVPNLPLIGNLYEKARQMRKLDVRGFMGCWNFGNMVSANTASFNRFLNMEKLPPRQKALEDFARDYFPNCDAPDVVAAWETFGEAMMDYPFSIPFIYMGPMNFSLSYPVKSGPLDKVSAGRSWMNDRVRGDDLSACINNPYTVSEIIRGFQLLSRNWKKGAAQLEKGLANATGDTAKQELDNAKVIYHIWRSTWNTFRIYKLRQKWSDDKMPEYKKFIADELENLQQVLPLVKGDLRFGFHGEAHVHQFDAASIQKKIKSLQKQLAA